MNVRFAIFVVLITLVSNCAVSQAAVEIDVAADHANIQNDLISVGFDLTTGNYTGINRTDNTVVFKDAWFRLGKGGWYEPK